MVRVPFTGEHAHIPFEPAEDVEETTTYCDRCDAERVWRKVTRDFSRLEQEVPVAPSVTRALEGEEGWVCGVCGQFREELVSERAYPVAQANPLALPDAEDEQRLHSPGLHENLALRAESTGEAELHEPATEAEALHRDPAEDAELEHIPEQDRRVFEELRRQERGDEALQLEHGPRRELPPPERVPRRDPTAETDR